MFGRIFSAFKIGLLTTSFFILVGCSSEKVDGTSVENFNASVEGIMRDMSSSEMQEFKNQLSNASFYIFRNHVENIGGKWDILTAMAVKNFNYQVQAIVAEELHGKSVKDIKELSNRWEAWEGQDRIEEERKVKENKIEGLRLKINSLYEDLIKIKRAEEVFKSIEIRYLSIQYLDRPANQTWPNGYTDAVISMALTNHSDESLQSVSFAIEEVDEASIGFFFREPLAAGETVELEKNVNDEVNEYLSKNPDALNNKSYPKEAKFVEVELSERELGDFYHAKYNLVSSGQKISKLLMEIEAEKSILAEQGVKYESPKEQKYKEFR